MEMICPTCKMKVDTSQHQRCPRCYTILRTMKKCEDCKGCSIFTPSKANSSNKSKKTCTHQN